MTYVRPLCLGQVLLHNFPWVVKFYFVRLVLSSIDVCMIPSFSVFVYFRQCKCRVH